MSHFHHLFEVETGAFKGAAPRPDAFNEMIGGDEMAAWLHAQLVAKGYTCSEVWVDDHGWDFEVIHEVRRYRLISSCEFEDEDVPSNSHFVQVAQTKGVPIEPDPILSEVRAVLSANADFQVVVDEEKRRR